MCIKSVYRALLKLHSVLPIHTVRSCHTECRNYRIVFYGTDTFSLASLKLLYENQMLNDTEPTKVIKHIHVISGENSLVHNFARRRDVPFSKWPFLTLPEKVFDVGIVVSFGHLIPKQSINACKHGILNVHGSLLPRWRGASPIHHAILAGDTHTGVTLMKIKPSRFDVGDIILSEPMEIDRRATTNEVHAKLAEIGARLLMTTLQDLELNLKNARQQSSEEATSAPKPSKVDGIIKWSQMSAVEVDRRVRALDGLVDVYSFWVDGTPLRLHLPVDPTEVETFKIESLLKDRGINSSLPGTVYYHKKRRLLCVKCADGEWIAFENVSLKGRRRLSARDFYNGYLNKLFKKNNVHSVVLPDHGFENHDCQSSIN